MPLHSPICLNQIHQQLLIQVHLQTQQKVTTGLAGMAVKVLKSDGVLGLYNGLSASVMRQVTIYIVKLERKWSFGGYRVAYHLFKFKNNFVIQCS